MSDSRRCKMQSIDFNDHMPIRDEKRRTYCCLLPDALVSLFTYDKLE